LKVEELNWTKRLGNSITTTELLIEENNENLRLKMLKMWADL
jgi:hypothetical protein